LHWSVQRTFRTFVQNYLGSDAQLSVLEIGSSNINGGLRDLKATNMTWTGVDLHGGEGVDQVVEIGKELPFMDESFDLVVASSVFEHDFQFWNTFLEMSRVKKRSGLILLIVPSQGPYHRFPYDVFRFYPDSGIALEKWAQTGFLDLKLIESLTTPPQNDVRADFVAVFGGSQSVKSVTIGDLLLGENWIVGNELITSTVQESPHEMRRILKLEEEIQNKQREVNDLNLQITTLVKSNSWKMTKPLRIFRSALKWN
jgi:SAM-dependent methyltransferase